MKKFNNGNDWDSRSISIKIDNDVISFYLEDRLRYFSQRQQYILENEIEVDDDEPTEPETMYWIPKDEWIKDKTERQDRDDNWHKHMKRKSWFIQEMENYINQQTNQ
jgi:hypothetical protein